MFEFWNFKICLKYVLMFELYIFVMLWFMKILIFWLESYNLWFRKSYMNNSNLIVKYKNKKKFA